MDNKEFNYTYSASTEAERRVVADIKKQYESGGGSEDKVERIKALDRRVRGIPMAASISCGVVGTLIFGLGMATVLEWGNIPVGIAISVLGLPFVALAYPLNNFLLRRLRAKHGPEIIKLSNEILGE